MGITVVVGSMATVCFVISISLMTWNKRVASLLMLYSSLGSFAVTIASHQAINNPMLMGKRSDGSFPLWSTLCFLPFVSFSKLYVLLKRLKRKEDAYNEIIEGLYLGGWPCSGRLPPGEPAVIDCTCELTRVGAVSKNPYLCVPTWDTRCPKPAQIEAAVRWACPLRAQKKPIYIHCANGHGRSVCVMCALLVTLGLAEDWKSAEKMVREKRPRIKMNADHRKNLDEWTKLRHLSKKSAEDSSKNE